MCNFTLSTTQARFSITLLALVDCCPLRGPGNDSSVGEWMYLTVCPHRGPGNDSSVGEWMYLTVCPHRGPGNDSSVGEWMYLTACRLHGPGHASSAGEWKYLTVCPLSLTLIFIFFISVVLRTVGLKCPLLLKFFITKTLRQHLQRSYCPKNQGATGTNHQFIM